VSKKRIKPNYHRRVLRIPDLDHCKLAVLNSLGSPASRRVYEYAIDQFTAWYCSEPRLAFNRIVVVRYRMHMESRGLAANTINQQLAAVRRLAHEAADSGLLAESTGAESACAKRFDTHNAYVTARKALNTGVLRFNKTKLALALKQGFDTEFPKRRRSVARAAVFQASPLAIANGANLGYRQCCWNGNGYLRAVRR
jgi:hypothetical protein